MSSVRFTGALMLVMMVSCGLAQNVSQPKMKSMKARTGTVCFGYGKNAFTFVPPPAQYQAMRNNPSARIKTATINVTYVGFESKPQAQTAFQTAVNIWQTLISSPVPINIEAHWAALGTNVLGSASPSTFNANFPNAQSGNIWYPIALAEKISGQNLNDTLPDIVASFSSNQTDWYFGTDGKPTAGTYDLVSVVLHEIGHGLGITHSYEVVAGSGDIESFFGVPVAYETFIENQAGQNLVKSFQSPSTSLGSQITSNALYINSPLVLSGNGGVRGRLYAPPAYTAGSSVAHLDENTYPQGNINSLMTPVFNPAEAIHDPGPIVKGLLNDMGWTSETIAHTVLPNTENVSQDFNVICQIGGDSNYDANSVKLWYTTDKTNFTSVPMVATANPNEFTATIPKPTAPAGQVTTYGYYMSVTDATTRTFYRPGLIWTQGTATTPHQLFVFQSGPDSQPPKIVHDPIPFVKNTDTQATLTARISDNIGILGAVIQYSINSVGQSDIAMTLTHAADSTYTGVMPLAVNDGDTLRYRIKATDNSVAQNVSYSPVSDYYIVNVVSLAPTQTTYKNNFNAPTTDFFGDSFFSIKSYTGFASKAIHSAHPYPNANASGKDSLNFVYQLRVPIKLKATGAATISYDEVVLVEPGITTTWPSPDFFDYVVVEGSKDGGETWHYLTKGYDSRDQSDWLTRWNSNVDSNTGNSNAVGDSTLYHKRTIDMTATGFFKEGDEIVIRFRLYSDPLAFGWGWAIDNLKIQIDETPPTIQHDLVDIVPITALNFDLTANVTDFSGVKTASIDYSVNDKTLSSNFPFTIVDGTDQYTLTVPVKGSNLAVGDEIEYRINAMDSLGNSISLPATGYFTVTALNLKTSMGSYVSNFNSANGDFASNFYNFTAPTGFSSGMLNTSHPYPNGFGLDGTSDYSAILKTPIKIDNTNSKITFNEVVLVETSTGNANDYVVVEGSKDGATWVKFLSPYTSSANSTWKSAYNLKQNGNYTLYKPRTLDMLTSSGFAAGDSVLIRFRLHANATTNAWGWAIDDLNIQGPVTGIEKQPESLAIYPNPVTSDHFNISLSSPGAAGLTITDILGRQVSAVELGQSNEQKVFVGELGDGIYIVKVSLPQGQLTKKIMIKR